MIVAEQKKLEEIVEMLKGDFKTLLISGCGTCVTVSLSGGEREVEAMAGLLNMHFSQAGRQVKIETNTIKRHCDFEFIDEAEEEFKNADLILSMACGVGVQHLVERFPEKVVVPALNTSFYGATTAIGEWQERCLGCGDCVLDKYGGVCPVARCSKSLLNGPCGGSQEGYCEVDPETDCGWELIFKRLQSINMLENVMEYDEPKNWQTFRDGGPRKMRNKEYGNG